MKELTNEKKALLLELEKQRIEREDRLRLLGFEDVNEEQRKDNLALNVALMNWPK